MSWTAEPTRLPCSTTQVATGDATAASALPPGARIVATIPVADGEGSVATGFGSVWVENLSFDPSIPNSVQRINPSTNQVVATIPVDPSPLFIAAGHGAIWVTNFDSSELTKIDPSTNSVVDTIPVGPGPMGVAVTSNTVWVAIHHADPDRGAVYRIDPSTDAVVAKIPLGRQMFCCGPSHVAVGAGFVWVDAPNLGPVGSVARINPATNKLTTVTDVDNSGCQGLAVAAGTVWNGPGFCGTQLARLDAASGRALPDLRTQSDPIEFAVDGDTLWATDLVYAAEGRLIRIDARRQQLVGALSLPGYPFGIAVGSGSIWVATGDGNVLRLQPA